MDNIQVLTRNGHRRVHQLANTHQEQEIQKLTLFLMRNYQGELKGNKTPVDVAIELLGKENR